MVPVDGGSARDLRAAAITVDSARQLTGLCATDHRPDARARAPRGGSFSFPPKRKKKKESSRSIRAGVSAERPVGSALRRSSWLRRAVHQVSQRGHAFCGTPQPRLTWPALAMNRWLLRARYIFQKNIGEII